MTGQSDRVGQNTRIDPRHVDFSAAWKRLCQESSSLLTIGCRGGVHRAETREANMSGPILLVEDNPDDQKLTLRAFKKSNIENEIVTARDGAEALDYLLGNQAQPAKELPALILLDLNLPKVSGLEVLRRVRSDERTKYLPIVILTSSKEEEDI